MMGLWSFGTIAYTVNVIAVNLKVNVVNDSYICGDLWRNLSNIFQQELSLLWKLQHIGFHFPSVLSIETGNLLFFDSCAWRRTTGPSRCSWPTWSRGSAMWAWLCSIPCWSGREYSFLTLHSFEVVIAVNLSRNLWSIALLLSKHHLVNHTISVVYRWIFFLILIFFKSQIRFLDKMLAYREWLLKIILKNTLSIWFMFLPSQVVHADSPGLLQGVHHESV